MKLKMDLDKAREIAEYRVGHTLKETSEKFNIPFGKVRAIMWVLGIRAPNNTNNRNIKDIVYQLNNGVSCKEIYEKLGITKQALSAMLYRHGYKMKFVAGE